MTNDFEISQFERIESHYGICFSFSLTFCGFLFLLTAYFRLLNAKRKISKLCLSSYIFGMHFCFYQSAELLMLESIFSNYNQLVIVWAATEGESDSLRLAYF